MPYIANLEQLLTLENTNDIIVSIDDAISGMCEYGDVLERLTGPQRNFFYNQCFEKEINNGGFSQFFLNSSGDWAHETVQSLRIVGASKTASILQLAIDEFPNGVVPKDREKRAELIECIERKAGEVWESLDREFYEYEEDLNLLNLEYVKQNKGLF